MKRPDKAMLEAICVCPGCGGKVSLSTETNKCQLCSVSFVEYRGFPVLITEDNPLFKPSNYLDSDTSNHKNDQPHRKSLSIGQLVKKFMPSRSINLCRNRVFQKLAEQFGDRSLSILLVGSGNQTGQIKKYFNSSNITFVLCDIDKRADVDVFCDAHRLPFADVIFDGLITTAVLEHVLYPEKVVAEMVRVLKEGAFIYSEVPFLQGVHEGAYDYTRYTMSGHRRLLERFNEIEAGMASGPATALLWSISDFPKGLFHSRLVSQLLAIVIRYTFFWIKYLDILMKKNSKALDFASATYFLGTKTSTPVLAESIVAKYGDSNFTHV